MRVVRAADQRPMPWKNGGGETTEIAVSPAGATLDDFDWRVSMARVASDGPFSRFAGVDRTLMIIDGDGLALAIGDGARELILTRDSPPHAFAGDVATTGRLLGGPILDLNVMTRRNRWTHRLITPALAGPTPFAPPAGDVWIVIAAGDPVAITTAPAHALVPLGRHDAAIIDAPCTLVPEGVSRVYVVELRRST